MQSARAVVPTLDTRMLLEAILSCAMRGSLMVAIGLMWKIRLILDLGSGGVLGINWIAQDFPTWSPVPTDTVPIPSSGFV